MALQVQLDRLFRCGYVHRREAVHRVPTRRWAPTHHRAGSTALSAAGEYVGAGTLGARFRLAGCDPSARVIGVKTGGWPILKTSRMR